MLNFTSGSSTSHAARQYFLQTSTQTSVGETFYVAGATIDKSTSKMMFGSIKGGKLHNVATSFWPIRRLNLLCIASYMPMQCLT